MDGVDHSITVTRCTKLDIVIGGELPDMYLGECTEVYRYVVRCIGRYEVRCTDVWCTEGEVLICGEVCRYPHT